MPRALVTRMVFGLIGAGLKIASTVKGVVDAGKAAKGGGGEEKAEDGGEAKAPAKADKKAAKGNPVDKFLGMLNNPNVRTLGDIKQVRDKVLAKVKEGGATGKQLENARRKLNRAVLEKVGITPKGGAGDANVTLTPKVQQTLAALGMRPDEIKGGAPPARPPAQAAPAPKPVVKAA